MLTVNIESVCAIIREVAEEKILSRFCCSPQELGVLYKPDDGSPVTIADKEAEIELSRRLSSLLEGSKVVGEESFSSNHSLFDLFKEENPVWIIDPIDGTSNFVGKNENFGVIVALAQRDQTLAGWIYHPTSGEFITAEKGSGAWHKGQRLKTLPADRLENMRGVADLGRFPKNITPSQFAPELVPTTMACSNNFPLLVASAPCFGKTTPQVHFWACPWCSPWDDAAGVLMVEESGGYFRHLDGAPFQLTSFPERQGDDILAAPDKESWDEIKEWCIKNGY